MQTKYGQNYLSAISKLSVSNPYDEKGMLKPEYKLSSEEKNALLHYVPEAEQFLDTTTIENFHFDQRYQDFLNDVRRSTADAAYGAGLPEDNGEILWDIDGIELLSWEVEEKYGEDVYKRACEEVPYESDGVNRMFQRDFSKANIKLGHIVHEGISASPLMDLDYFIKLLKEKGIPAYIDFETNTFHYNGVKEEKVM